VLSLIHVLEWRAAVTPEKIAISDHLGTELSFAALAAATDQRAAEFAAAGIGYGDVVAIIARNQVGWVTAVTGLIRTGALPAAVNWRFTAPEITELLRVMRPVAIVTDEDCGTVAKQAAAGLEYFVPVLMNAAEVAGTSGAGVLPPRPAGRLRGPEPAVLVHTSGTTGKPKLVPQTHQQLISAAMVMQLEVPEARPGARHLCAMPLYHPGTLASVGYALLTGGHLHLLRGFEAVSFVNELAARRIQLTLLVPTLIRALTAEVSARAVRPDLSNLIEIAYGAAPIRPDVLAQSFSVLRCRFRQIYGSTETGPLPISVLSPADHDPARGLLGTAGRPSLGWEVRLGERGEIQVRGAAPLPRYWADPEATSAALTPDGFYRTGDVGTIDARGYLTIIDRLTDVIISGGENVFPGEVEAVLAGHAAVADVAVIGIPDVRWGETVHAVVVPRTGPYTDAQFTAELIGYARQRLAGFKCPTGVTLVPSLPRSAGGKLVRASLRAPFWVGRDRRVS
jgi:acyl-CoA synthetase (AMP-forming)/AMP-acid ligase II